MYPRLAAEKIRKTTRSVLLLGPRQTGKSTLIKDLNPDLSVNLAFEQVFLDYSAQPNLIEKVLEREQPRTVFIDEVQRIPSLLNTVQGVLDQNPRKYRFYLTGSSARKLRRGRANLLPGRVVQYQLGPLIWEELGNDLDLDDALAFGTLPGVVSENESGIRQDLLRTYASTYLKEEVQAEALTREIEGFARFLFVAASKSGEFLDFSKMGSLAGITQKTSSRFFEILEDTLIVNRLNAYAVNETRRLVRHPKFYFFDNGVLNGLLKNFTLSEDRRGFLFEHFVVNQIMTANSTLGEPARLSTYRTEFGSEVDLLIEKDNDVLALEIKSGARLTTADSSGLKSFSSLRHRKGTRRFVLLYAGSRAYNEDSIEVLPWRQGLSETLAFLR
jgi:predicted AAA+ superfamily ATPase